MRQLTYVHVNTPSNDTRHSFKQKPWVGHQKINHSLYGSSSHFKNSDGVYRIARLREQEEADSNNAHYIIYAPEALMEMQWPPKPQGSVPL